MKKLALLAACFIGIHKPAFGEDQAPVPSPAPAPREGAYDPSGLPLHGNPNPATGQANAKTDQRDEKNLANRALDASSGVTETSGSSELLSLLARAEEVKEGTTMPRHDLVELRMNLQRFRNQGDDTATRVDEEINRLEAIILGLEVKPGK